MAENTFDIVSVVNMAEVLNSCQQAMKEAQTRFDLKNSKSELNLHESDKKVIAISSDDFKLKAVLDLFRERLARRRVPLQNISYGPVQAAGGDTVRQEVLIQSGIPIEKAKAIVKKIKDSKMKVQATIQGDVVRVGGKSRDTLQELMHLLRKEDFGVELQFINFRGNA